MPRHDVFTMLHLAVGCAVRTDWLNGAHGAPYDISDNRR